MNSTMELPTKCVSESISSVSINSELFTFSVLMLYHTAFYKKMIHKPYILESYIVIFIFLSIYRSSIYFFYIPFFFLFTRRNRLIFFGKNCSCYNYMIDTSYSDCFGVFWGILTIRSHKLVISFYSY